jgi:hypothetical protein
MQLRVGVISLKKEAVNGEPHHLQNFKYVITHFLDMSSLLYTQAADI